jgi:probable rRNA maturation factor
LLAAHRLLQKCHLRELSIAVVGDAEMKRLHKKYLGINTTTDVLTFELEHDAQGRVIGGEVVVCMPQARRQARLLSPLSPQSSVLSTYSSALAKEVLLLALHGMLHLSGFDDKTDRQFMAMHRAENRILSRLGVGPVFGTIRTDR